MPRTIDATLLAAMTGPGWQPVVLASFAFRSQTEYVWTGRGDLVWNGNTFRGIGTMGALGNVGNGSAEVVESGTTVELSGIDASILGETMTDVQPNGAVSIWIGAWQNGALLGTPYLFWRGGMGRPQVTPDPEKFRIVLELQTSFAQMSRATNRRYTAADQRRYYPDDTAFNWVEILNDIALRWGN